MNNVKYPAWEAQDPMVNCRRVEAGKHAEQTHYNAPTAVVAAGHIPAGRVIVRHPLYNTDVNGHNRTDSGWRAHHHQLATLPDDSNELLIDGELGVNFVDAGYDPLIQDGQYAVLGVSLWNEFNMNRHFGAKTYSAFDGELMAEATAPDCNLSARHVSYTMDRPTYVYACGDIDLTQPLYFTTEVLEADINDPLNTKVLGGFNTDGEGQAFPWARARTACKAGDTFIIEFVTNANM